MSADLTLADYRHILERICGLVAPWEALLEQSSDAALRLLAPPRARLPLLHSDLQYLGSDLDHLPYAGLPEFTSPHQLLGAMYVMEGSRLGGQLLARHLAQKFPDSGDSATTYFRGFGARTGPMWKEFVSFLEAEVPESQSDAVIDGAHRMFQHFRAWVGNPDLASFTHPTQHVPTGGQ